MDAGTLYLAKAGAFPDGTALTVGAGGTLIFDPSRAVAGPMSSFASGSQLNPVPEPGTVGLLLAAFWTAAIDCRFRRRGKGI